MRNRGLLLRIAILAIVVVIVIIDLPLSAGTMNRISWLNPSAAASGVEFGTHSSYRDTSGYLHVVGEVINNSGNNVKFVKVVATYYDQYGVVIRTEFTYTELDILVPGQKSPFDISSYPDEFLAFDHYIIQLTYTVTTDEPCAGISI